MKTSKGCGKMELTEVIYEKPNNYDPPDYDGLWKRIIEDLFKEFMQFFAPDLHDEIDFTKTPIPLKQEYFKRIIKTNKGKNIVDKIMQVSLKNGEEKWILIHIEVQAKANEAFSKRMFRYFYRIYDYFDRNIYAIALVTDRQRTPAPSQFHYSFYGTEVAYTYNCYRFQDHSVDELEKSNNPFAYAVIAGKYANQAKDNTEQRFAFKQKLMKQILRHFPPQHEQSRSYLQALFHFIEYLLQIPGDLQEKLENELFTFVEKEGYHMHVEKQGEYPPSPTLVNVVRKLIKSGAIEEPAYEDGMKEGKEEGKKEGKTEATRNFTKTLINENYSDVEIMKLTKLKQDEIDDIRKSLQDD